MIIRLTDEKGKVREVEVKPGEKIEVLVPPKKKPNEKPDEKPKPVTPVKSEEINRRLAPLIVKHAETVTALFGDGSRKPLSPIGALPAVFFQIVEIDLRDAEKWRTLLADVAQLPALEAIANDGKWDLSAADLLVLANGPAAKSLRRLPRLRELDAPIVESLKRLPKLEAIAFVGSKLGDEDLLLLKQLPTLRGVGIDTLGFAGSVSRRGWEALASLPLRRLALKATAIPADGFAALKTMRSLQELDLSQSTFAEDDLAAAASWPKLAEVRLSGTPAGDIALAPLAKAPALRYADLRDTKATVAGIGFLGRANPLVEIDYRGSRQMVGEFLLYVGNGGFTVDPSGAPKLSYPFTPEQAKQAQRAWADQLKLPIEAPTKLGIAMILIPPAGEAFVRPYLLGKYEVTQEEWQTVMDYNPSVFNPKHPKLDAMDTAKFPVDTVSWFDSVEFCNKLSAQEGFKPYYQLAVIRRTGKAIEDAEVRIVGGNGYHIPTDIEWTHGCRAGTKTKYYCGDKDEDLLEHAWFNKNSDGRTHPVGEKKANAFGLYDIHGNVREWTEEMLTKTDTGAPERVNRGGNWNNSAGPCAVTHRYRYGPAFRNNYLGLRLARVP